MRGQRHFYVYMQTSSSRRALYTGVTGNLYTRNQQHKESDVSTFAGRYRAFRLVYVEVFEDIRNAIAREKEIKGWIRAKKEALVRTQNPRWEDLSISWRDRYKPENQPQDPSRKQSAQDDKIQNKIFRKQNCS